MKVTIAAAISIDGKLTKHDEQGVDSWISDEDQVHFKDQLAEHAALVFGRTIYDKSKMRLKLIPDKLRIVLTSTPDKYVTDEVKGQLEFRNEPPAKTVEYLKSLGKHNLLVTGGTRMLTEFLQANLVDELYLTIEPRIFGDGVKLVAQVPLDIKLKLIEQTQLNDNGTMLLRYKVL